MKLYLWGWRDCDSGQKETLFEIVQWILEREHVEQVLHISFARTGVMKCNRWAFLPERIKPVFESWGVEYLDGRFVDDIAAFNGDSVYINGGNDNDFLVEMCSQEPLLWAIMSARVIVWESAGAMVLGQRVRSARDWRREGLGIVKNTIIEPHYVERDKEFKLRDGLDKYPWVVWVGIDEVTFVEYEWGEYGEVIGERWVYHIG